jgi:hypothetical protein
MLMRFVVVSALGILTFSVLTAQPGLAASREPLQLITAASSRASSEYDEGLRRYYAGDLERAEKDFLDATRRDPKCALAFWGLSRVYQKQGKAPEALTAAEKATQLAVEADDREKQLTAAWKRYVKAASLVEAERKKEQEAARRDLEIAIAIYSADQELWLTRGEIAESPLRSVPFNLAAFRLRPDHPFAKTWSFQAPPAPQLTPKETKPVPAVAEPPRLMEGLGNLTHKVTATAEAQAYYEQGLRCWHSYVAPMRNKLGAGANFQHAAALDPDCAMAYWGLSFCVQQGDVMTQVDAANRALELAIKKGTDKERRFCAARVLELSGNPKREEFLDALDAAIAAYPDDVELWIWRGKAYTGYSLGGNVVTESLAYQIAANRMHPEHPAPNHELIHGYERIDRPALGWPYTVGFREAAPNMPHANHMQAHLAMRLGRWEEALDCGRTARKKSLEGYPELDAGHHIDIMLRALGHEGLFKEAAAEPKAYRDGLPWARLLQLKAVPEELDEWVARRMATNSADGFYVGAIAKLNRNDLAGAAPLVAKVEEQWNKAKASNMYRYNEVKGRYLVQSGNVDDGLKLLKEAGARAVKDTGLHAWGGGSYILEVWGETALRAHRWDEAEEAFHEALAHEHGSILGALGMQVVWENRGRSELAAHYATRAAAIWKNADAGALDRQLERLRKLAAGSLAVR